MNKHIFFKKITGRHLIVGMYCLLLLFALAAGMIKNTFPVEKNGFNSGKSINLSEKLTRMDVSARMVTLKGTLPDSVQDDSVLFIYSRNQNFILQIDGNTAEVYNAKRQPDEWSIEKLNHKMAKKSITIVYQAEKGKTLGYITPVYMGEKTAVIYRLLSVYGLPVFVGFLMLCMGIFMVVYTALLSWKNKERFLLLGGYLFAAGFWFIVHSQIRQMYWENGKSAESMMVVLLISAVIMFLLYFADYIRKIRYEKANIMLLGIVALFIGCIYDLYFRGIKKSSDSCMGSVLGSMVFIVCGFYEFTKWLRTNSVKERRQLVADEEKTAFLGKMSHQIRTPVNTIMGMNTMIADETENEKVREYTGDIERAGNALVSIIDDILDFSKMGNGELCVVAAEYHLSNLLNDCYHMVAIRAKDKGLDFKVSTNAAIPDCLYGDEIRIRQIIINLLTNAVKYTRNGTIWLTLDYEVITEEKIQLKIAVKDTGVGIRKENIQQLFIPYRQLDLKKNRGIEGTGLGLSITKQLIDLMKGTITVESVYGEGSVFTVVIPQKVMGKKPVGNFEDIVKSGTNDKKKVQWFIAPDAKILAVDDTPMNRKVITGILRKTQMDVRVAAGGKECLKMLREDKYDLIFMDYLMPEMDGIETFRAIKKDMHSLNQKTPVIMLTANAMLGARTQYLAEGFADYLAKPVDEAHLYTICSQYIPEEKKQKKPEETSPEDTLADKNERTENSGQNENASVLDLLAEIVSVKEGLSYCMDDTDFYLEVIQDYLAGDKKEVLETTFAKKDWKNYQINVHALKSTSRTIGANAVSDEAKQMEEAAKGQDEQYIMMHQEELMKHYEILKKQLKDILSNLKSQ